MPLARDADGQVGTRVGFDAHLIRQAQQVHAEADFLAEPRVGLRALEQFGMLVADHHDARTARENLLRLGRMQHALDRAVDHHVGHRQRFHDRLKAADREARPRRADRDGKGLLRRRQHDVEDLAAEAERREFRQLDQHRPRLGLGQDCDGFARLQFAEAEHVDEGIDPFAFDAFSQHAVHQNIDALSHRK